VTEDPQPTIVEHEGRTSVWYESGDGPPVVLFHGFPDHPRSWDGARAALAGAGFRAIAPYLRGYHPATVVEGRGYSAREIAEDAGALLDALDLPSATLVGHDWGASVVWGAAALTPERVDALVPIAIPHPATLKPTPALAWFARHFAGFKMPWAEAMARRNDFAYIEGLYGRWSPSWTGPERDASVARVKAAFADPVVLHHALEYYRALSPKRPPELEAPITARTLVVGGSEEPFDAAYAATPGHVEGPCEVLIVPGAGHWPHREGEAEFVERLLAFLSPDAR
jgi:pimeloyl-ACP methyl ester carboxylesterase